MNVKTLLKNMQIAIVEIKILKKILLKEVKESKTIETEIESWKKFDN